MWRWLQGPAAAGDVVGLVGVQLCRALAPPAGRACLIGGMASSSSSKTTESWRLAPVRSPASGRPPRSTTTWRFVPGLPRSVGLGRRVRPPFGRDAGTVQAGPAPVDPVGFAEAVEQRRGAARPRPRPPASRAAGASRSSRSRSPSPGGSISQGMPVFSTKMMPVKAARSGDARSAALGLGWLGRQQRGDEGPQLVADKRLAHAASLPCHHPVLKGALRGCLKRGHRASRASMRLLMAR